MQKQQAKDSYNANFYFAWLDCIICWRSCHAWVVDCTDNMYYCGGCSCYSCLS